LTYPSPSVRFQATFQTHSYNRILQQRTDNEVKYENTYNFLIKQSPPQKRLKRRHACVYWELVVYEYRVEFTVTRES